MRLSVRGVIPVFTKTRHLSLSWTKLIHFTPYYICFEFILILSSHLRQGLLNDLFLSDFNLKFHIRSSPVLLPCNIAVEYLRFGGPCCVHLQGEVISNFVHTHFLSSICVLHAPPITFVLFHDVFFPSPCYFLYLRPQTQILYPVTKSLYEHLATGCLLILGLFGLCLSAAVMRTCELWTSQALLCVGSEVSYGDRSVKSMELLCRCFVYKSIITWRLRELFCCEYGKRWIIVPWQVMMTAAMYIIKISTVPFRKLKCITIDAVLWREALFNDITQRFLWRHTGPCSVITYRVDVRNLMTDQFSCVRNELTPTQRALKYVIPIWAHVGQRGAYRCVSQSHDLCHFYTRIHYCTHLNLVPGLRMRGATPPLPHATSWHAI
jgi:hypothetical protein